MQGPHKTRKKRTNVSLWNESIRRSLSWNISYSDLILTLAQYR